MRYEVKELSLGEILDQSISLLKNHFQLLAVILATLMIPVQIVTSIFATAMTPSSEDMVAATDPSVMIGAAVAGVFSGLVVFLVNALTQGAVTWGIAELYLGRTVTPGECIRTALHRWPALIATALLAGLGVAVGFMLFIVPGVYLAFAWYIVYPVLMIEGLPVRKTFGRSRALMKGHMGKAFVVGVVLFVIGFTITMLAELVPGSYPSAILSAVVQSFIIGFNCIVVTMIYFSARCLVENFDLELLAGSVARQSIPPKSL